MSDQVDQSNEMNIERAKADRVFLDTLYQLFGSEGTIENVKPEALDMLAAAFAAGYNYEHPKVPAEGDMLDVSPVDDTSEDAHENILLVTDLGMWRLFDAATDDDHYRVIAIQAGTDKVKLLQSGNDDDEEKESWQE